jgi:hypothetical protein
MVTVCDLKQFRHPPHFIALIGQNPRLKVVALINGRPRPVSLEAKPFCLDVCLMSERRPSLIWPAACKRTDRTEKKTSPARGFFVGGIFKLYILKRIMG